MSWRRSQEGRILERFRTTTYEYSVPESITAETVVFVRQMNGSARFVPAGKRFVPVIPV